MNSILLVDQSSGAKETFIHLIKSLNNNYEIFGFSHQKKTGKPDYYIEKLDNNEKWIPWKMELPEFILRLRHGGDYFRDDYSQVPKALLNVCYGGEGYQDTRKREDEEIFYAPLYLEGRGNYGKNFSQKDMEELLLHAIGDSSNFPSCLLPYSFNKSLEEELTSSYKLNYFSEKTILDPLSFEWNKIYKGVKKKDPSKLFDQLDPDCKKLFLWNQKISDLKINTSSERHTELCSSYRDFKEISNLENYDMIFIMAELSWQTNFLTSFEGVQLISELRRFGYRGLIIMVSFAPWKVFEQLIENHPRRYKVLNTPYLWFMSLYGEKEFKFERLPNPKISVQQIRDLKYYVLDNQGLLQSVFHGLKGKVGRMLIEQNKNNEEIIPIVKRFFEEDLYGLVATGRQTHLDRIKEEVLQILLEDEKLHPYFDVVHLVYQKVLQLIPGVSDDEIPKGEGCQDWGILFIDDYKPIRNEVKQLFNENGIVCFTDDKGWDAFERLEKDAKGKLEKEGGGYYMPNFIKLLLVDYRLLKPGGKWQTLQGYDIIQYASNNFHNVLSYAFLTDKRGAILREAQRKSTLQTSWFSKELLLASNTRKYFVNEIMELGLDTHEASLALNENDIWNKGREGRTAALKPWYTYYRTLTDYRIYENAINEIVIWHLELVDLLLKPESSNDASASDNILNLQQKIKNNRFRIPLTYTARLLKIPKHLNEEFSIRKGLPIFICKLLGRRIIIALFKKKELFEKSKRSKRIFTDENDVRNMIEEILKFRQIKDSLEGNFKNNGHLFKSYLALPKEDWGLKSNWLPEEIAFLNSLKP